MQRTPTPSLGMPTRYVTYATNTQPGATRQPDARKPPSPNITTYLPSRAVSLCTNQQSMFPNAESGCLRGDVLPAQERSPVRP